MMTNKLCIFLYLFNLMDIPCGKHRQNVSSIDLEIASRQHKKNIVQTFVLQSTCLRHLRCLYPYSKSSRICVFD